MIIEVKGADYSSLGLGYADWVKAFIANALITDEGKKTAIRNFNTAIYDAGLWPKIYGIAFFPGSTQATQKLIFKEGITGELSFIGNGAGATGFQAAEGVYAKFPFSYPADSPTKFSMGIVNKTSETNPTVGTHRILMTLTNTPNHRVMLSRRYSTGGGAYTTFGQAGPTSVDGYVFPTSGTYDNDKIGFLQIIKDGGTGTLLDGATTVKTNAITGDLLPGGTNGVVIGAANFASGSSVVEMFSASLITFAYWGKLSVAEAIQFSGIVSTFLTAFGR